ncbi:MAG: hypothetical protein ACW9W4_07820 [Candidatus Nitrosopumilus sp. bin_7KS]
MSSLEWFPTQWLKSAAPVLTEPGNIVPTDTEGTIFYVEYQNNVFAVTATHVLDACKNPMICYYDTGKKIHRISTSAFSDIVNLNWVHHPDNLIDISAIPFTVKDYMDIHVICESDWNIPYSIEPNEKIIHIGYPEQLGATYADGALGYFPIPLIGTVMFYDSDRIVTNTNGQGGASGGPLFVKSKSNFPQLVGIVKSVPTLNPKQNKTLSLPISLIKDLFESEPMKKQVLDYQKFLKDNE